MLFEVLNNRKSIRKFKNQDIDNNLLVKILEGASHTQTMGNLQLYSVVVTKDKEHKEKLAPAHFNQSMITSAPVVLTVCADYNRTTVWANCRKGNPGFHNMLSFVNAASDALLYTQNVCNLAEIEGLGVCYIGTTIYNPMTVIKTLHLPQLVMPIATLTIGWPDETPAVSERLSTKAFVHQEYYKDYTPEAIDELYSEKENLEVNKQFVSINHMETLAQVFTDIRYTKKDNEFFSESFMQALKAQGFM